MASKYLQKDFSDEKIIEFVNAVENAFESVETDYNDIVLTPGENGENGKSAYEIAVDNGFVGTEQEWLSSLKGKDGTDGIDGINGVDGEDGIDGTDGTDGKDGKDGKTPYQIYLDSLNLDILGDIKIGDNLYKKELKNIGLIDNNWQRFVLDLENGNSISVSRISRNSNMCAQIQITPSGKIEYLYEPNTEFYDDVLYFNVAEINSPIIDIRYLLGDITNTYLNSIKILEHIGTDTPISEEEYNNSLSNIGNLGPILDNINGEVI